MLEDGLRRIAMNASAKFAKSDGIVNISKACLEKQVYNSVVHNQVGIWADIRNKADHGQFEEVTEANVRDMLAGIQQFLGNHLA